VSAQSASAGLSQKLTQSCQMTQMMMTTTLTKVMVCGGNQTCIYADNSCASKAFTTMHATPQHRLQRPNSIGQYACDCAGNGC
jgi:hypothetical protein